MSRGQTARLSSRLLRHPGPVAHERFSILSDGASRTARVRLEAGQSLVDALDAAVRRMCKGEARAAAVTLQAGYRGMDSPEGFHAKPHLNKRCCQ